MALRIAADIGEVASGVPAMLDALDVEVELGRLPVADYVVSDRCAVERKTANDFAISIGKKRLWRQIPDLRDSYERAILLIEGPGLFSPRSRLHPELVRRAIASIICDHGLSVLMSPAPRETAAILAAMAWSEQTVRREVSLHDTPYADRTGGEASS